jgi:hypothetical protein
MQRSKELYVNAKPVTCDEKRWGVLAASAAAGARRCCPHAAAFFDGISAGMDGDAYMALLDFELYMLEVQRQLDVKAKAKEDKEIALRVLAHCKEEGNKEGIRVASKALVLAERRAAEVATSSSESSSGESSSEESSSEDDRSEASRGEEEEEEGGGLTHLLISGEQSGRDMTKAGSQVRGMPNGRCTGFAVAHEGVGGEGSEGGEGGKGGKGGKGGDSNSNSKESGRSAMVAQTVELPLSLYGFGDLDLVMKLTTTGQAAAGSGSGGKSVSGGKSAGDGEAGREEGAGKGSKGGKRTVDPNQVHKVQQEDSVPYRVCLTAEHMTPHVTHSQLHV